MIKYTGSLNLNATTAYPNRATKPTNVAEVTSTSNISPSIKGCSNCKSLTNIDTILADQKGKKRFCSGVNLIRHEENCIIEIQKIIEYFNQHELSSFQVELNIP
jgi:hypothetical protein